MVDIVEEILGPPPETHPPAPEIHGLVHVEDLQFVGVHYSPDKGILIGVVEDAEILSKLAHGLFEFLGMSREKLQGSICIWRKEGNDFNNIFNVPMEVPPSSVVWKAVTRQLLIGQDDGMIRVFDFDQSLSQCKQTHNFRAHEERIRSMAYHNANDWVVSVADDKAVRIFQPTASAQPVTGRDAGSAQPSAMEMDEGAGLLFVGNWAEQVLVFDINSKPPNQVHTLAGHSGSVRSLLWDKASRRLFSGSFDMKICIWHVDVQNRQLTSKRIGILSGHQSTVTALGIDQRSDTLFSADYSGYIFMWNLQSQSRVRWWMAHDDDVRVLQFVAPKAQLLSAAADGIIKLWDMRPFLSSAEADGADEGRGVAMLESISVPRGKSSQDWQSDEPRLSESQFHQTTLNSFDATAVTQHRVGGGGYSSMQDDALEWTNSSAEDVQEYI